ncbi:MAG: hypothetical protein CL609_18575 [Anaerolineaceae bacterium]|nr:hypothetical protein [Anaerolineaceae bacterium]
MVLNFKVKKEIEIEKILGWVLFCFSLALGIVTLYIGVFDDEADNLVTGAFITQGKILYKDVFTHHFPFTYYLMAFVVSIFGKSLFFSRLSVLLFQLVSLIWCAKLTKNYLPIGITSLIWSVLRVMYLGNMVLYNAFCAISLLVVFILVLNAFVKRERLNFINIITIVVFSFIAIMSDPLAIYPIFVAGIFITIDHFKAGVKIFFLGLGFVFFFLIFLIITNSFQAFYSQAIHFNTAIYSKYVYTNPNRFLDIWKFIRTAFDLFNPVWWNFDIFRPITFNYTDFDRWFFTGGIYRIVSILIVLIYLLHKKFLSGLFVYLFLAATLVINPWGFRAQPFVLLAVFIISLFCSFEVWKSLKPRKVYQGVSILVLLIISGISLRVFTSIVHNFEKYNYKNNFSYILELKDELNELTCEQNNVLVGFYPSQLYFYWYTDYKFISKYTYLWPWVAEVALDDILIDLKQPDINAIVIRKEMVVWDHYDTREYLKRLDEYLVANYINIEPGLYMSPNLEKNCESK